MKEKAKKIAKYVSLSAVALVVLVSLAMNASQAYKAYADSLRVEGYKFALQQIDSSLQQNGKVDVTKSLPDGKVETFSLVPETKTEPK